MKHVPRFRISLQELRGKVAAKLMFSARGWVGQRVKRFWEDEGEWFEAVVTDYAPPSTKRKLQHKLTYDIGTKLESFEWYDLDISQLKVRWTWQLSEWAVRSIPCKFYLFTE